MAAPTAPRPSCSGSSPPGRTRTTGSSASRYFPLGVGLGGIGEAQRFVSTAAFHYPDNLSLFLLASFGVVGIFFLGVIFVAAIRGLRQSPEVASCALGVLTFIVMYGSFVSIIEDQMEALFLGASVGVLLAHPPAPAATPAAGIAAAAKRRRSIADQPSAAT